MSLSKDPIAVRQKSWRSRNYAKAREIEKRSHKKLYWNNPEKHREYARKKWPRIKASRDPQWYQNQYSKNRDKILAACARYRNRNKDKRNARNREYYKKNKAAILARNKSYAKRTKYRHVLIRRQKDPLTQLRHQLGSRMRMAVKCQGTKKYTRTEALIGCTIVFFRQFLAHQFTAEMTWENHGKYWHIDHVIPIKAFNLRTEDGQKHAFHYSNCRPLEKTKNIAKSDSLPGPHQPFLL